MSEFIPEIECRRAKRAYSEKPIPEDMIGRIMTAATYAPSCFNNQSWRFMVVSDASGLALIHEALTDANYWVKKSPLILVIATKPDLDCQLSDRRDYAFFDCGMAAENLMLQAFKEGLYAHALAGFDPLRVKKNFSIPEEFIVISLMAVGFPGTDSHLNEKHLEMENSPRIRKPQDEVICYDHWAFPSDEKKS